jgi:hypothetical protein
LVHAIGLARQRIAGYCVRATTAAATNVTVFTDPAITAELIRVAKREEGRVILVRVDNRVFREPTALDWQKAGGEYLACMADKHNPVAVANAERCSMTSVSRGLGPVVGRLVALAMLRQVGKLHHRWPC